jgi:hypothetical protein
VEILVEQQVFPRATYTARLEDEEEFSIDLSRARKSFAFVFMGMSRMKELEPRVSAWTADART